MGSLKTRRKYVKIAQHVAQKLASQKDGDPTHLIHVCEQDFETLMLRYIAYRVQYFRETLAEASGGAVRLAAIIDTELIGTGKPWQGPEAEP